MTYRQLQQELRQLRNEGRIPDSFKLNQKKSILQAMIEKLNAAYRQKQEEFDSADRLAKSSIGRCISKNTVVLYSKNKAVAHNLDFQSQLKKVLDFVAETVETYNIKESLFHVPVTELDSPHGVRTVLLTYAA